MSRRKRLKLLVILLTIFFAGMFSLNHINKSLAGNVVNIPEDYELPFGSNPFAPSNARTTNSQFISQQEFIPAARCAECHRQTHKEWSESAHRNSFREPFYKANVEHLIRDRDIAVTRHCESCHNPPALFSGALSKKATMERPFDDEGVTCSVCHSIESVTTEGIGSYTINTPAILVREKGERVRDDTNEEIFDDLESHKRAVMRPLLQKPEFCAACHKSAIVPELNGRKWLRTFSVYDEWQQSAFSDQTTQPLDKKPYVSCQSCHMPEESANDYKSHRWAGGNTAIPAHYGWDEQLKATENLLKSGVVSVDIFAVENKKPDENSEKSTETNFNAPINDVVNLSPGEKVSVDVVVANRGVGHAFPAELRDMFEAWLEFKVVDAKGKNIYHSGAVKPDGTLEWAAHAYRNVPIDDQGEIITKHDIWNTRVGAIDRFIPAGRADLGRFSFTIPKNASAPLRLVAKLNYRRFNQRYIEWVKQSQKVDSSPVVEMSVDAVTVWLQSKTLPIKENGTEKLTQKQKDELRKRWRTYAVALFDQQQYEAAIEALEQAQKFVAQSSPQAAALWTDLALAYMRMERSGNSQAIIEKATHAIGQAKEISPTEGRVLFYEALLDIKKFRYTEALTKLKTLNMEFPFDRQVQSQIAALYLLQRRDLEALTAYEKILNIDPDDTESHFKLGGLYWRFGLFDQAKREQSKYQARHNDTAGETLKRQFLRKNPELYSTWVWREFGDNPIGTTP